MKFLLRSVTILVCFAIVLSVFTVSAENGVSSDILFTGTTTDITNTSDYDIYNAEFGYSPSLNDINTNLSSTDGNITDLYSKKAIQLKKDKSVIFEVTVPENSAYNIKVFFADVKEAAEEYHISLSIDGKAPFKACDDLTLYTFWEDNGENRKLPNGDEIAPSQKHIEGFSQSLLVDSDGLVLEPYKFMLSAGTHKIKITCLETEFYLGDVVLTAPETVKDYKEVSKNYTSYKKYDGAQIVIEGEDSLYRNSASLSPKSDRANANVSPANPINSVINYTGGESWSNPGDTITWEFNAPKDGLYKIGFSFKQSYVTNGETFRNLKIDGKTPFAEASKIGFDYAGSWQYKDFTDENNEPYMIYLKEGRHEISLSVILADTSEVLSRLGVLVEELGALYLDMLMITGESPDANRDYELHKQVPNFEEILKKANEELKALNADIGKELTVNGELTGALNNMIRIIEEMTTNLYEAHLQVPSFSSAQQTLSAWLYDMRQMPLGLDQIIIGAPEKDFDTPQKGFWEKTWFGIRRFIAAYTKDYNGSRKCKNCCHCCEKMPIWQ